MQITLKQSHIEQALRDYVAKAGITFNVDDISFTAGRGKDGLTAAIELEDPFSVEPISSRPARDQQSKGTQLAEAEPEQADESTDSRDAAPEEASSAEPESPFVSDDKQEEAPALSKEAAPLTKAGVSLFG